MWVIWGKMSGLNRLQGKRCEAGCNLGLVQKEIMGSLWHYIGTAL